MSQTEQLYNLLRNGVPIRTDDILKFVYGSGHLGCARISARIKDVKSKYKVDLKGWHDQDKPNLYRYPQLLKDEIPLGKMPSIPLIMEGKEN